MWRPVSAAKSWDQVIWMLNPAISNFPPKLQRNTGWTKNNPKWQDLPCWTDFKWQKRRRTHEKQTTETLSSPITPIINPGRNQPPCCTCHRVMQESLEAVTTMSSFLLEWRPQILSSWPSNVFTHSFVLIVQSFKRPSDPLLEEKYNIKNHWTDPFLLCPISNIRWNCPIPILSKQEQS